MSCIIQRKKAIVLAFLFIAVYANGQKPNELTLSDVVAKIDSIYSSCFTYPLLAQERIMEYTNNVPKSIRRRNVYTIYMERLETSIDNEDIEGIIRNGEIYMYVGAEKDLPWVIEVVAKVHALLGHESEVNSTIRFLEVYSKRNANEYEKEIEELRKEVHALLHPPKIEDALKGKWVMLDTWKKDWEKYNNPVILWIDDVTRGDGAGMIPPNGTIGIRIRKGILEPVYSEEINVSQGISFNGIDYYLGMQFGSTLIIDRAWLGVISTVGTEVSREVRATTIARIKTPKDPDKQPTFEEIARKAGQEVAVNLLANGLDKLMRDMTYSTNEQEVYGFALQPTFGNLMLGTLSHKASVVDNDGNEYISDDGQDKEIGFVRWEETDSVIFVSANGKPITLNPIDKRSPLLSEYYKVRRETSFWNPECLIPSMLFTALGGFLLYRGVQKLSDNGGNTLLGVGLSAGGIGVVVGAIEIPLKKVEKKRTERFRQLNKSSYHKLYSKGRKSLNQ